MASEAPAGRRLHPAAIGVWAFNALGPLLVVLVAGGRDSPIVALLAGLSVLLGVVRWLRFRWRLDGQTLVLEQGLIQRKRRVIPLDRIQAVEVVAKLRHRVFGVVELRVETVGGTATEGRLEALRPRDAQLLRADLLRQTRSPAAGPPGDAAAAPPPGPVVLARLSPDRLVVAGLTGGRVGIAAALVGVGQDFLADRFEQLLGRIDLAGNLPGVLLIAAAVLAGAFVLSVVATLLTYWNFTLTTDGVSLQIRRGLLDQRSDTMPLRRIQALHVDENFLRRPLGLAAVKVEVAGRSGGEEAQQSGYLLPLCRRGEAMALVERVWGLQGLAATRVLPMPAAARSRRLVRAVVTVCAVSAVAVAVWEAPGAVALLLLLPAVGLAIATYRSLGQGRCGDVVVARSGVVVRRTSFVRRDRLQSLALRQSYFQRRRGLASLALQIARGRGATGDPQLIDLDAQQARGLLETLTAPS